MKRFLPVTLIFFLLAFVAALLSAVRTSQPEAHNPQSAQTVVQNAPQALRDGEVVTLAVGSTTIRAEVAASPAARERGLSGREELREGEGRLRLDGLRRAEGMLFVFEEPGEYAFWMKDMNFAIDIFWIDEAWRVAGVTENVAPETFPEVFSPPEPVLYVLEVPAGMDFSAFRYSNLKIRVIPS